MDAPSTVPALSPTEKLIAESAAVEALDTARFCLRKAARELDKAGDTGPHRHVLALMASTDDCLEDLARSHQS